MSNSSENQWSDDPNAPKIPSPLYSPEKENFSGIVMGAVFYGIAIALFFKCIDSLFSPTNRLRGGIKWGLVVHTTAMFSFLTVSIGIFFSWQSAAYIDDREFPGVGEVTDPGPLGYLIFSNPSLAIQIVENITFPLNQWLADGLLLYRCYVIYYTNFWIIALPCLMYLATVAMGIVYVYELLTSTTLADSGVNIGLSYFGICVSLNVLLTLMIVARLVLHSRNVQSALGPLAKISGLYTTIVTVLVESSAIYAVGFLLYIGPLAANSSVVYIFAVVTGAIQVIAPFLIVIRIANRSALTHSTITSANIGSLHFRSRGKSVDDNETGDGYPTESMGIVTDGDAPGEPGVCTDATIDEVPL